jgi:hypothetical protein
MCCYHFIRGSHCNYGHALVTPTMSCSIRYALLVIDVISLCIMALECNNWRNILGGLSCLLVSDGDFDYNSVLFLRVYSPKRLSDKNRACSIVNFIIVAQPLIPGLGYVTITKCYAMKIDSEGFL